MEYIPEELKCNMKLSAISSGASNILFTSIIGAPVGIASASLTLNFSLATEINKKLLNITRNKKKKHDKIFILAKSKPNCIEILISQALTLYLPTFPFWEHYHFCQKLYWLIFLTVIMTSFWCLYLQNVYF